MYATRDLAGKCCQPFEVPTLYPSHAKASWKSAHRNPSNLAPKVSHKIDIWYQYPCDQITWIQVLGIWQELIEDWDGELFADGLDELVVRDHEKLAWSGLFHKYVYATADQHKYYERRSASNPRLVTDLNGNQYIYIYGLGLHKLQLCTKNQTTQVVTNWLWPHEVDPLFRMVCLQTVYVLGCSGRCRIHTGCQMLPGRPAWPGAPVEVTSKSHSWAQETVKII